MSQVVRPDGWDGKASFKSELSVRSDNGGQIGQWGRQMMTSGAVAGRQALTAGKGVSLRAYVSAATVFGQIGTMWCGTRVVQPEVYHG